MAELPPEPTRQRLELDMTMELAACLISVKGWAAPEVLAAHSKARKLAEDTDNTLYRAVLDWGRYLEHFMLGDLDAALEVATGQTLPIAG